MSDKSVRLNLFDGAPIEFPAGDRVAAFLLEGWFEANEQAFLRQYLQDGDVFLDVGAHAGLYSVLAKSAIGAAGRLIAIEPNPAILPFLAANIGASLVTDLRKLGRAGAAILPAALADESGTADFYAGREGYSAYSSLSGNKETTDAAPVPKYSLDDLVEAAGLERIDFIKVDIEGAETLFLAGATRTLKRFPDVVVMMEFSEDAQAHFGETSANLGSHLHELGFRAFEVDVEFQRIEEIADTANLWHRNLIIARDSDRIASRLASAPAALREKCAAEARRGAAALRIYHRALAGEALARDLAQSLPAIADIQQIVTGADDSRQRISAFDIDAEGGGKALISFLRDELGRLQGAVRFNSDEMRRRGLALHDYEAALQKRNSEIAGQAKKISALKAERDALAARTSELQSERDALAARTSELQSEREMLEELSVVLREEIDRLATRIDELSDVERRLAASRQEFNRLGDLALELRRSRMLKLARTLNSPVAAVVERMAALYIAED